MKTKMLLTAALVGAASLSALSAQAGVHFGFSLGLPLPVVVTAPVAPVYVTVPAPCPAPAVVVDTPACPGPDYVWAPGYWTVRGYDRVWVAGNWNHRPAHVVYAHGYDHDAGRYGHDGYRR